ncbi:MAG: c-type cytochrome [Gammaproteobacteria bacterium]|nr:c-type cytochrome [Gammaproteobacteria bacterium]
MKKLPGFALIFVIVLGNTMAVKAADGDAEKGKVLFAVCMACHGENGEGNAALNAPATGGQDEWYVVRQLNNFRAGVRGAHAEDIFGAQMRPMALTLPNEQAVMDVAAYIATLPLPELAATSEGNTDAGKKAFAVCVACHGANGEGNVSLNAPRLSGQYDWYIERQLKNFKAGIRGTNPKDIYGAQMRPMAMILVTDEQVRDVTAYIATLE